MATDDAIRVAGVESGDRVVLLLVIDVGDRREGSIDAVDTVWALGEPAVIQPVALGAAYGPDGCTVATLSAE